MELLFFVMNKIDLLDDLMRDLMDGGIRGATVVDSTGMAHMLNDHNYIFGSLRQLLNQSRSQSKTIFMVCRHEEIEKIVGIIENLVGSLDNPDTGVVFTVPVSYTKGFVKK